MTEAATAPPAEEEPERAGCKMGLVEAGTRWLSVVNADLTVSRCGLSEGPMVVTCSCVGLPATAAATTCWCAVRGAKSIGCSPLSGGFSSMPPGAFCAPDILHRGRKKDSSVRTHGTRSRPKSASGSRNKREREESTARRKVDSRFSQRAALATHSFSSATLPARWLAPVF